MSAPNVPPVPDESPRSSAPARAGGETPARYRMLPVVIEAMRYETTIRCIDAIQGWAGMEPRGDGTWRLRIDQPQQFGPLVVHTLEGDVTAQPGDWIIRGVRGEFYPCKPDIFALTYEPAPAVARPVAEAPTPDGWTCEHIRSHGRCNGRNGPEDETCGACGEDRPVAADGGASAGAGMWPSTRCPQCGSTRIAPTKGNGVGNTMDCLSCFTDFTPGRNLASYRLSGRALAVAADGGASDGAEIPEDIALALSDLQRESRAVGEYGYGPDRGRFEREEAKARAECDAEIRSALSAARAQAAEATAERARLRNLLEAVHIDVASTLAPRADIGAPSWAQLARQYGAALRAIQQYVAEFDPVARADLSPASPEPSPDPKP
jgi:hypothetical protein